MKDYMYPTMMLIILIFGFILDIRNKRKKIEPEAVILPQPVDVERLEKSLETIKNKLAEYDALPEERKSQWLGTWLETKFVEASLALGEAYVRGGK